MGTKRRLPLSDAEVLAAYQAGESQRALALRLDVSKGAVQKAIERAKRESHQPSAPPGSTRAPGSRPMSDLDIRERLEHEALHASDSRTRLNALKMLQDLKAEPDAKRTSGPSLFGLRSGTLILEPESSSANSFTLRLRNGPGIERVESGLTPANALYMIAAAFGFIKFSEEEIRAANQRRGISEDNEQPQQ